MMRRQRKKTGVVCVGLLVTALATLGLSGSAQAFSKEFVRFQYCPYTTSGVLRCLNSVTTSGEVILGNKKVPIVNPVTLQGGYGVAKEGFSALVEPTNKITLSKTPQPVPGGLAGIVPEASSPPLVKALIKFFFENKLTGLESTLELAKSTSDVQLNEVNLRNAEGVALKMPVKVHLENPFLGKSCYIGSSGSPLSWNLTAGVTAPKEPNKPIEGASGEIEFIEGGRILGIHGNSLVDNAWSAPTASGCGGILSFLVNPIINSQLGTTTAGHNTAILNNTLYIASAAAVKKDKEEHP